MKKFFRFLGLLIVLVLAFIGIVYFSYNEAMPEGELGQKADSLAMNMQNALNKDAFDGTEVLEWSFRGKNHYKWYKQEGKVVVTFGGKKILLNLFDKSKSEADSPELIEQALKNFNNDSFWLVAPYKVFDEGTERRIVNYKGKEALLVTYSFGGTTPGDSYLWILDENYFPISYKMWVSIFPIGGISASWNNLIKYESGIYLPTSHELSLFGLSLEMGDVKAYNPKANELADKILNAIHHKAYKNTRYIDWSFGGRRSYKWDKQEHIVEVSWDKIKVILHPADKEKSIVYLDGEKTENKEDLVERAWNLFNNDSFWLVAPHKLYDDGVFRNIVQIEGKEALKVKYTTGGTTLGDSYIWELDSLYIPKKYYMYVPSMKMEGIPATWEGWITTESGTLLPKSHEFSSGGILSMGNVKAYN